MSLPPLPNLERPRPTRRILLASTALLVLALVALGVNGAISGPAKKPPPGATGRSRTSAALSGHSPRAAGGTARRTSSSSAGQHRASTTATTAGRGPLPPTSSQGGSDQYVLTGTGPVSLVISATGGACWAEAGPTAGGPVSWEGTIPAGQAQVLAAQSTWWVRLGAPGHVQITADGRPLVLAGPTDGPLDITVTTA
jgi:hypothetical protein